MQRLTEEILEGPVLHFSVEDVVYSHIDFQASQADPAPLS